MSASFLRRVGRRGTRRRVHARFYRRARTPADLYPAKPGNMPLVSFCLHELFFFFSPLFVYGSFMKAESLTGSRDGLPTTAHMLRRLFETAKGSGLTLA